MVCLAFFIAGCLTTLGCAILIGMVIGRGDAPQRELDWYDM